MSLLRTAPAVAFFVFLAACRTSSGDHDSESSLSNTTASNPFRVKIQNTFEPEIESLTDDEISVCTFNISFVGHWKARDKKSEELAAYLQPCDVVAVQELVAPPMHIGVTAAGEVYQWLDQDKFLTAEQNKDPDELIEHFTPWWTLKRPPQDVSLESKWRADYQAFHFIGHMKKAGFDYVLSLGDSGRTAIYNNTTASEWHVVFYRPTKIAPAPVTDMPTEWTKIDPQEPLVAHPIFDRVPHSFGFRTLPRSDGKQLDFVLINVHLHATQTRVNEREKDAGIVRAQELLQIQKWITEKHRQFPERDYIVLGDMNIYDNTQLEEIREYLSTEMQRLELPGADTLTSLNLAAVATNISTTSPKPFDQVIFDPAFTSEIIRSRAHGVDLIVANISEYFNFEGNFGGQSNQFIKAYSDHMPLMFIMKIGSDDD